MMATATMIETVVSTPIVTAGAAIPQKVTVDTGTPSSGRCYVLGCYETVVHENGVRVIFRHRRFGLVHACVGHDPARG
jgi:hypothetical protein